MARSRFYRGYERTEDRSESKRHAVRLRCLGPARGEFSNLPNAGRPLAPCRVGDRDQRPPIIGCAVL